jgi:hypothetical protein
MARPTDQLKRVFLENEQTGNNDLTEAEERERQSLLQTVKDRGTLMEKIHTVATTSRVVSPDELELRRIWLLAYEVAITVVLQKGLAFYNAKGDMLRSELELAVIRADEVVEAFIKVRNGIPDPIQRAVDKWVKAHSTNPLDQ